MTKLDCVLADWFTRTSVTKLDFVLADWFTGTSVIKLEYNLSGAQIDMLEPSRSENCM